MPTHAEVRVLHHSPEQLFDLVADVGRYPEFLPWCVDARIRRREENLIVADLVIGYRMFRERFTSTVTLSRPNRIDVSYSDGPFRYLNNHWIFIPEGADSCTIDFFVDFEFHSRVLQLMVERVFGEAVKVMVHAFERRADELFGSDVPPPEEIT
tara:strand:+ start:6896 stop:7357 length:462 start_codon:yes stop_codon:yes gene_type:complete